MVIFLPQEDTEENDKLKNTLAVAVKVTGVSGRHVCLLALVSHWVSGRRGGAAGKNIWNSLAESQALQAFFTAVSVPLASFAGIKTGAGGLTCPVSFPDLNAVSAPPTSLV